MFKDSKTAGIPRARLMATPDWLRFRIVGWPYDNPSKPPLPQVPCERCLMPTAMGASVYTSFAAEVLAQQAQASTCGSGISYQW